MIELLTSPRAVLNGLLLFAASTLVIGGMALFLATRKNKINANHPIAWLLIASGPITLILWFIFNAIENWLGLESIIALLLNLGLFAAIGLAIGYIVKIRLRRQG